jgi:TRAP-type mannitol/chloroaromatic compound transport system permease small subunit
VVAFAVVAMRYVFSTGFPWLQETYIWLHGAAFMLAMGWVLRDGGHVRVDVLARHFSPNTRALVDIIGVFAFLLPMMGMLFYTSLPQVERAWRIAEKSPTADGLAILYVLKTVVPVACVLVMLQGLALAGRSLLIIGGREYLLADPAPRGESR